MRDECWAELSATETHHMVAAEAERGLDLASSSSASARAKCRRALASRWRASVDSVRPGTCACCDDSVSVLNRAIISKFQDRTGGNSCLATRRRSEACSRSRRTLSCCALTCFSIAFFSTSTAAAAPLNDEKSLRNFLLVVDRSGASLSSMRAI